MSAGVPPRGGSATKGTCAPPAPTATKGSADSAFVTVWKVDATASARGSRVLFAADGNFTVDWGDGCTEQGKAGLNKHTYVKKGEYTVSIGPGVTQFWLSEESTEKLIEIKQWGRAQWNSMNRMFDRARSMICTATDKPDLSKVENMMATFRDCKKFHRRHTNSPIEHWDTKGVKNIRSMLSGALMFNRSLAKMDISSVEYAGSMLEDTPAFDQDLRDLNIGDIVDTAHLFGWQESLAQYKRSGCCKYNEEHGERFDAKYEKQDVYGVLDGAGACRML